MLRPATDEDLDDIVALALAEEVAWWGEAENSPSEVADWLDHSGGLANGVVEVSGGRIAGFATVSSDGDTSLVVDSRDSEPPYDALVGWLVEQGAEHLEVYATDKQRAAWLERHGWVHVRSSFDLAREGSEAVPAPVWPADVTVRPFDRDADARAVHHLVYVEARWADVPGHTERPFESWAHIFTNPEFHSWVAWRGDRPVGWLCGRIAESGRGLIVQIAVATSARGQGLGRALLLHGYTDLLARGATSLGLGVQAANENAIGLYTSIGLEVEREWRIYEQTSA